MARQSTASPTSGSPADEPRGAQRRSSDGRLAVEVVCALQRRQPVATGELLLHVIITPIVQMVSIPASDMQALANGKEADDSGGGSGARGVDSCVLALQRLHSLLTLSPPSAALCDAVITTGVLGPLLHCALSLISDTTCSPEDKLPGNPHLEAVVQQPGAARTACASLKRLLTLGSTQVSLEALMVQITGQLMLIPAAPVKVVTAAELVSLLVLPVAPLVRLLIQQDALQHLAPLLIQSLLPWLVSHPDNGTGGCKDEGDETGKDGISSDSGISSDGGIGSDGCTGSDSGSHSQVADVDATARERLVQAALQLLDSIPEAKLSTWLRDKPAPVLMLLRAALPAAINTTCGLVEEREESSAAEERLLLCLHLAQLLVTGAGQPPKAIPVETKERGGADESRVEMDGAAEEGVLTGRVSAELRQALFEIIEPLRALCEARVSNEVRSLALSLCISISTLPVSDGLGGAGATSASGHQQLPAGEITSSGAVAAAPRQTDSASELREVAIELVSSQVPLRAAALSHVRALILQKNDSVMARLPELVSLCEAQLMHEDSFVYQARR